MNPLKYLFEKPALSNRTAKWLMMLSEFEIAYVVPKAVKGQAIADHLSEHPFEYEEDWKNEFPDELVMGTDVEQPRWELFFYGIANKRGYSARIISQIQGKYRTRDLKLQPYHKHLECVVSRFEDVEFHYLPREINCFSDAIPTLASMVDMPSDADLLDSAKERNTN